MFVFLGLCLYISLHACFIFARVFVFVCMCVCISLPVCLHFFLFACIFLPEFLYFSQVSEHLVEANLQSVDSHGVVRLTQYTDQVR